MATLSHYGSVSSGARTLPSTSIKHDLRLARRLDWQLILPSPSAASIGYWGNDDLLREALRRFHPAVIDFSSDSGVINGGSHPAVELAVLSNPTRTELCSASDWLSPTGSIYVEVDRGTSGQSLRALTTQLVELGLEKIESHFHYPSFSRCRQIIPIASGTPIKYLVELSRGDWAGQAKARTAQLLQATGLLRSVAPSISVTAQRKSTCGDGWLRRLTQEVRCNDTADVDSRASSFLVMCPHFETSRHVILLALGDGLDSPMVVIKASRLPGDDRALSSEYDNLLAIQALRAGGFDSIPRALKLGSLGERAMLVETGIAGELIRPGTVRSNWERCVAPVYDWLIDFNRTSLLGAQQPHSLAGYAEDAAAGFASVFDTDSGEKALLAFCVSIASSVTAPVPSIWQHADLGHPNLFLTRSGSVGVIDWELANPGGLPMADLIFFLSYVAFARARAESVDDCIRALREAFFVRHAWARPLVRKYADCIGLSAETLTPLFVLCWMDYVVARAKRVSTSPADQAAIRWIRQDRYYHIWRHVTDHVRELNWQD